jgi:hypothetical protein
MFNIIAMLILEFITTILLADFVSGVVHWTEDTFWTENTPVMGHWVVKSNVLHHKNGSAITRNTWLQSSWGLLIVGIIVLGICVMFEVLTWHIWLFLILSVNANQIHKWNHISRNKIPSLVGLLQKFKIIQSPKHHANHHKGIKNTHYCVITDFTNPILDKLGFWRLLESLLVPPFKAPRRTDIDVKTYS